MKPWEQQPGESDPAYRAARIYFEAGPDRTLRGVDLALLAPDRLQTGSRPAPDRPRRASSTVRGWSAKYRWLDRARAFDQNLDQAGDQARETERASQATILEQRRAKVADTEWDLSQVAFLKVAEMLQWPLKETTVATQTSPDGTLTQITTIAPTNWRLRDITALLRVASELQRLAVGMPGRIAAERLQGAPVDPPVDQVQADADNSRIPPDMAEAWLELATQKALAHEGRLDAQPDS